PRAVREVHAVATRDRSVDALGRHAGRSRLLTGQPEIANEARARGIAEVVDLRHPVRPPAGWTSVGNEVGDARIALPPVLVRLLEAADDRVDLLRSRRIRH